MVRYCSHCWKENPYEAATCEVCGADLGEEPGDRVERLIAALDHPLGATRRLVAGLLGRTGDPRAVEALSAAVREAIARRDWELLDGVVEGLADSGSREAAEALEVIAEQGYAPARRRAREALGQLGRAG